MLPSTLSPPSLPRNRTPTERNSQLKRIERLPTPPRRRAAPSLSVPCLPPRCAHSSSTTSLMPGLLVNRTSLAVRGMKMTTTSGRSSTRTSLAETLTSTCGSSCHRDALLRWRARATQVPRPSGKVTFAQRMLQAYVSSVSNVSSGYCKCFILVL
jgi:hypothetical protein